ncbi:DegT/DnrJ/EryC1/StrS family aminotransferase [Ruegeria lacuscaerulensis]|uniref:DegT/DnrJ/EryC1/StrS family aminotransferase n=1 Tax=Ruegeria lacuscaerulensis TaxID=55218 RepID=UPI001480C68E|nr:DegT/DnrJ/EryC1/StrS family aminotransferase [Ruegeria lacuscaerulensis]
MAHSTAPLNCGDPSMRFARLFQRDSEGGFTRLFEGRRVHWSFNTRVAIRAGCDLLGLRPGDEVLVPAYNCGSEVDPLIHAGLSVRLYPVVQDLRIDPARIEALITDQTRAIYVTHYFGVIQPDLAAIRALCDSRGLRMIEDCALSLLSGVAPAEGYTGDVSVFCFYKFVPVLQGGALIVNAPDLNTVSPLSRPAPGRIVAKTLARSALVNVLGPDRAQSLKRALRNGADAAEPVDAATGEMEDIPWHYYFDPALQNRRISAFALRPLRSFSVSDVISTRRANWHRYRELLDGMPGVEFLKPDLEPGTCPLNMPLLVADRDRVARDLQACGIGATPWWAGFNRNLDWTGQDEAIALKNTVLSLPLHQFLGPAHLEHIVTQLRQVL